jgi:hypothetical protein
LPQIVSKGIYKAALTARNMKQASEEQKLVVEKYEFDHLVPKEMTVEDRALLFDGIRENPHKRRPQFQHVAMEYAEFKGMLTDALKTQYLECLDNGLITLRTMKELMGILGLANSFDTSHTVTTQELAAKKVQIKEVLEKLNKLLGVKVRAKNPDVVSSIAKNIASVFRHWSGMEFVSVSEQPRRNGYENYQYNYALRCASKEVDESFCKALMKFECRHNIATA